jgi:hypothetical protein
MSLFDDARSDALDMLADMDPVELKTPDGDVAVTVPAMGVRHHMKMADSGNITNSLVARITVHEDALLAAGYTVRNTKGEVALVNHKVTWTDNRNVTATYIVREQWPNDELGVILLILGTYN